MAYKQQGWLDRSLSDEEEEQFRQWARDNYKGEINECWHPVVKMECARLNECSICRRYHGKETVHACK